ncbi:hypothetical protein SD457_10900 [Coprobacillaceae bacterium CR2/5/TPMF4]|nr:hypothetical protein SD457_10900 [Coprobacillaceae bacterium CR2/5/TPMF4]
MTLAVLNQDKARIYNQMIEAMHNQDAEAFKNAFEENTQLIQKEVLEKAKELADIQDQKILAQRGIRQLTNEERRYYEKFIEAAKSQNFKQALTNPELVMPETVLDAVFDDLQTQHPLLSHISFTNTQGAIKFLLSENGFQKAVWGNYVLRLQKRSTLNLLLSI